MRTAPLSATPQSRLFLCLFAWSALCMAVSCWRLAAARALWTDELFSLTTAEEAPSTIWRLLLRYRSGYFDHPPLYFLFLHTWMKLGNSPIVLRAPSILFAALSLALWSFKVSRDTHSPWAAAGLAVVLAFHPALRLQAMNVRMYALLLLLASAVILLVERFAEARGWRRNLRIAAVAVLLSAIAYTSYFGILLGIGVGSLGIALILRPQWAGLSERWTGIAIIAACLGAAILTLPWLPAVFQLMERESAPPGHWNLAPGFHGLTRFQQIAQTLFGFAGSAFGVFMLLAGLSALIVYRRDRIAWVLRITCLLLIPMAILVISAPSQRAVNTRYLIYGIPIFLAAATVGWASLVQRWIRKPWLAGVIVFAAVASPAPFHHCYAMNAELAPAPDWWAAAEIIEANALPQEFILTGGYLSGEAIVYHLDHPERYSFIHYVTKIDPFYLNCRDPKVVWYVNVSPLPVAYQKILFRYFPYRVEFAGNHGLGTIQVFAKKPFTSYTEKPAPYCEPIALDYEQAAGIK